jgi:hypothetical protein
MPDVRVRRFGEPTYFDIAREVAVILVPTLLAIGLLALFIWIAAEDQRQYDSHKAFMGLCIEFHSADRCLELDKWGRRDLLDRRDSR